MPVDFTTLKEDAKITIENSAQKTDDKLASKISSLITMKDDEIKSISQTLADVEKFVELMEIVKSAEN